MLDYRSKISFIATAPEETGLVVAVGSLTGVYKNMTRGIIALVFRCALGSGEPAPNVEVTDFEWMTPDEIQRELNPVYAIRVLDALADRRTTIRLHDGRRLLSPPSDRS